MIEILQPLFAYVRKGLARLVLPNRCLDTCRLCHAFYLISIYSKTTLNLAPKSWVFCIGHVILQMILQGSYIDSFGFILPAEISLLLYLGDKIRIK